MQRTLGRSIGFDGLGLHTGAPVHLRLRPAPVDSGIWFQRADVTEANPRIAALWNNVAPSRLCTMLANEDGVSVSTVEHLMAALAGCGIHNAVVEIDGPEVPILDGSAAPFVASILAAGIATQNAPLRAIEVLRPIEVRDGPAWARLEPGAGFEIDFEIDFDEQAIGQQRKRLNMANGAFVRELCDSRTFCRMADVEAMRAQGLARGGTLSNALVVDGTKILTPGGARHEDEPVRHKMLDALGDLALAGRPLRARMRAHRGGHALTNALLRALFADPGAYRLVNLDESAAAQLPGVGLHPADIPAVA